LQEKIEDFLHSDSVPATATKYTLMFLALGVLPIGGAIVPGVLKAMREFGLFDEKTGFGKKQIRNALDQLKKMKLAEVIKEKNGKVLVRLTNKGLKRVKEFSVDLLFIPKPKTWDKKWRILIFDIPVKPKIYNLAREALRKKVKELGFYQMQKSVWVYPYECEDELLFIAEIYQVQKYIEILTVEKMLHEKEVKSIFGLL
jgi:DNA-binding transcriptional regulator PaaX